MPCESRRCRALIVEPGLSLPPSRRDDAIAAAPANQMPMPRSIVEPRRSLHCPGKDDAYGRCPVNRDDAGPHRRSEDVPLLSRKRTTPIVAVL